MKNIIQFINTHIILSIVWCILLSLIIFNFLKNFFSKIKILDADTVIQKINKNSALIVDIRSKKEYQTSHILDSIHLTTEEIKNQDVKKIKKYRAYPIIIVCNHEGMAVKFAQKLNCLGFSHVAILKEGITGWKNNHLPLIS